MINVLYVAGKQGILRCGTGDTLQWTGLRRIQDRGFWSGGPETPGPLLHQRPCRDGRGVEGENNPNNGHCNIDDDTNTSRRSLLC